ncbi:MAG: hypothetical protein ACOVQ2_02660 [Flavobacterium sp.]
MKYVCFFWLFIVKIGYSQDKSIKIIDSLYREDQFYFNFTYNTLINKSDVLSIKDIAFGFNAGFLRDFPVNKSRTWALAPGFGVGTSLGNNILINNLEFNNFFKFSYFNFDIPLEIRWRDSNPTKQDFLRIHGGFKLSYLYFYALENIESNHLNRVQYGPYFSIGYGTWNFYVYYGLTPVFSNQFLSNEILSKDYNLQALALRNIQAGFKFYFL